MELTPQMESAGIAQTATGYTVADGREFPTLEEAVEAIGFKQPENAVQSNSDAKSDRDISTDTVPISGSNTAESSDTVEQSTDSEATGAGDDGESDPKDDQASTTLDSGNENKTANEEAAADASLDSADLDSLEKEAIGESTVGPKDGAPDSNAAAADLLAGDYDINDPAKNGQEAGPATPEQAAASADTSANPVDPTQDEVDAGAAENANPTVGGTSTVIMDGGSSSDQQAKNPKTGDDIDPEDTIGDGATPAEKLQQARDLIASAPMAGGVEAPVAKLLVDAGAALGLPGYAEVQQEMSSDMKRVRGLWDATQKIFKDAWGNTCVTITKSLLEITRHLEATAQDEQKERDAAAKQ